MRVEKFRFAPKNILPTDGVFRTRKNFSLASKRTYLFKCPSSTVFMLFAAKFDPRKIAKCVGNLVKVWRSAQLEVLNTCCELMYRLF